MLAPFFPFDFITVAIFGLCCGSFATVLIYRIPHEIPWIYNSSADNNKTCRSACPSCGHHLTVRDLVPILSWLCAKGRCRYCDAPISTRYPLTEFFTMIAVLIQFYAWGWDIQAIPVLLAVPFLMAALIIDWDYMILPNDTNIALTVLAIAFVIVRWHSGQGDLVDPFAAACALTLLLWGVSAILSKWKGRAALGRGDLKFLPAAGLFLGVAALPSFLALSGALGVATAVIRQKIQDKQEFPFGPALIISLYLHVFLTGIGFDYTW